MIRKLVITHLGLALIVVMTAATSWAAFWQISITNLAHGSYFAPLLLAAHDGNHRFFEAGTPASTELQALAEGGDFSGLSTDGTNNGADVVENPAGGLLAPGAETTAMVSTNAGNLYLSIAAMIIPTNDGFVGLDALAVPTDSGTYTYYLPVYDAGTEANNELVVTGSGTPGVLGIPGDPTGLTGSGGTGVTTVENNQTVHIHRGMVTVDDDKPVAQVIVTRDS